MVSPHERKIITSQRYGELHQSTLLPRWNGELGKALREYAPKAWPGVPPEAWLGFTSISYGMLPTPSPTNATENTTDGNPNQRGHEVGLFQTPAGMIPGPAPNPDPWAPWNTWGRLHDHPWVTVPLGRDAVMGPDEWKTHVEDQVVVGLADLRAGSRGVARRLGPAGTTGLDPAGPPSPSTWAVALGFLAFSEGGAAAYAWIRPYESRLASVPENRRWSALGRMIDEDMRAGDKNAPASKYKTAWGKFEGGKQVAHTVGDGAVWDAWYDEPDVQDPALWDRLNTAWRTSPAPASSAGGLGVVLLVVGAVALSN